MFRSVAFTLVLCSPVIAAAQKPPKKSEPFPGYVVTPLKGFPNVIVSNEVLKENNNSFYERKPLQALEMELAKVVEMLPPPALKKIQGIYIWVEWDQQRAMRNGRPGYATASYLGGHQANAIQEGLHPLQAKAITIFSMKSLTEEYQGKQGSRRCLLLHEIAHAVHFEFLGGSDNPQIASAYRQAMQRKLYDPSLYATTNDAEFFAEMTCAYFDQLDYFPKTRSELEKHDPVTFKVLAGIWGKARPSARNETAEFDARLAARFPLFSVNLGEHVAGTRVRREDLQGVPVAIVVWNGSNPASIAVLSKAQSWLDELEDFDLCLVAAHWNAIPPVDPAAIIAKRGLTLPTTDQLWIRNPLVEEYKDFPKMLVYSHQGECVYVGDPTSGEKALRKAVGAALAAKFGKDSSSESLQPILTALKDGAPPMTLIPKLAALVHSGKPEIATEAKALVDIITANGRKRLMEAEATAKTDPTAAYFRIENMPTLYKGTQLALKAGELIKRLAQQKEVALEIRGAAALADTARLESALLARPGSFEPSADDFRRANAGLLKQYEAALAAVRKNYPNTRAAKQAEAQAARWGLRL